MRVTMPSMQPDVNLDVASRRSIVLRLRTLRVHMTPAEAINLADLLVDATERIKK